MQMDACLYMRLTHSANPYSRLMPETCTVPNCTHPVRARGWCATHWARWRRTGDPLGSTAPPLVSSVKCDVADCERQARTRRWCSRHYHKWLVYGDPLSSKSVDQGVPLAFFQEHLFTLTDDCKVWPFAKSVGGYGRLYVDGRMQSVHTLACTAWHGPMRPPRTQAAHGPCHNPACFNGSHLSWKTPVENAKDRRRDGSAHFGALVNGAKLNDQDVLTIRARLSAGESRKALAAAYGVHYMSITQIHTGKTWKHLLLTQEEPR